MRKFERYDVVVFGGGSAGISAATQAGLAGARTLLVEKTAMLGGTTTNGGVNYPGLFHAWGKQIIAGIGWNIVKRTVAESGGTLPDFTNYKRPHHLLQIRVNTFIYAAICDETVVNAGVDVLFHAMPATAIPHADGTGWRVAICTKGGLTELDTTTIVDATGDANVAALAGLPLTVIEETQPATLSCSASGYEAGDLDLDAINCAFDAEVKAGRLKYTDASWTATAPNVGQWLRHYGANANHVHCGNAKDSHGRTLLELEARKSLYRLYRFFKTQPGLENLVIDSVCPECGVRETVTIQGQSTITVDDYQTGRVWDDAVCHAFYPIDLHKFSEGGLMKTELREGVIPTVPRGALIPKNSRNFLVAGRCLSSDRLANSALRVQATCMATGQAAGAMAALSAREMSPPEELPMDIVRDCLQTHGAVVPG